MIAHRPKPRSSLVPLIVLACAVGCSRTTPAGPLGDPLDLRPHLPAGVSPAPEAETTLHRARMNVGDPPAEVQVAWRTFQKGPKAYVLSATATVERVSSGLHLSSARVTYTSFPSKPDGPEGITQTVTLTIDWERQTLTTGSSSSNQMEIRGDGSWK